MLSIHKYIVGSGKIVEAPVIHWLKVDYQERERRWVAWALIDLDAPYRIFEFKMIETGAEVDPEELKGFSYIDTVNLNIYVAHFFIAEIDSNTGEVMIE